jgi:predicted outer membrane repeat protein
MSKRGPNDLEEQLDQLQKQKVFLQNQCRKAGGAIFNQEKTIEGLKKDIDRLSEENDNLKTMLKGNNE